MATLTDDQFLLEVDALISGKESALKVEAPVTPPVETPPVAVVPPVETPPVETPPVTPPVETPPVVETPPQVDAEGTPVVEATPEVDAEGKPIVAAPVENTPAEPDYKAIHARLFGAPIRAGGQDITLTNVDEAVSLIQKGVGFHSKMNRLQGDLKYVEMLRNNGLLDESKLSLLIDAKDGKPGAIKKLLDSAKIDPLTLDSPEASAYAPSDHRVTDEQVRFQTVVTDLSESAHGTAILQDAKGWDQASKAEVYRTPDVLGFLAQQKEMGRYDQIKNQVERQKVMGTIPVNESFLTSYTRVGQQMMQAGAFGTPTKPSTPTPVAQVTVTPTAPANPGKAAAAAPTRRANAPATGQLPEIKDLSDADFEKQFKTIFKI